MPLFNYTNSYSDITELEIQKSVMKYLIEYEYYDKRGGKDIFSEVYIPEVRRISDIILWFNKKTLINIECKKFDVGGVILQAKSHLRWADYSYACMPSNAYISNDHRLDMINSGIGLLIWDIETKKPIEAIFGKYNSDEKFFKKIVSNRLRGIIEYKSQYSI